MYNNVEVQTQCDSMCWIVHIFILDWQVLCTAVHASVQHRIFVVYAEVASQVENRQEADQRYFSVYSLTAKTGRVDLTGRGERD